MYCLVSQIIMLHNLSIFEKNAFPVFSLITYQEMNILLFGVFMILGKQKTPGDIPPGVFCFPQGKQKTPGAIHNLNQSKIWIALGVFYFPSIIMKTNNRIIISSWVINENTENGISSFNRNLENKAKCQSKSRHQHRPLNADEKRSHRVQLERVPKFTKRSTLVVKRANRVSFFQGLPREKKQKHNGTFHLFEWRS